MRKKGNQLSVFKFQFKKGAAGASSNIGEKKLRGRHFNWREGVTKKSIHLKAGGVLK